MTKPSRKEQKEEDLFYFSLKKKVLANTTDLNITQTWRNFVHFSTQFNNSRLRQNYTVYKKEGEAGEYSLTKLTF